ncbi:cation diffusion facilitator family transporter [Melissospora conviva]|uniref:cation diffusion facilitator family transporter n=1 Tax=Melissospora conviva TaxID=3388432 RepID=UPI003C232857
MGAGHDHHAQVMHAGARHRGRLWAALAVLAGLMVAETVTALVSGSLALLSDAGHMFTDVLGIAMALAAISAARRGSHDPQRTFGLYRLEVLAALANAVLLSGVACYVLIEAVRRFSDPPTVLTGPMLAVAVAGVVANLIAFALLRSGARESINMRGAYLEVLADLLGSIGVIVAAVLISVTGWWWVDPLAAVAIGVFILPRTWRLGRSALRILVQAAPRHLPVAAVSDRLRAVPGVCGIHDLHVWTLTSGMEVVSAHLTVAREVELAAVLAAARAALHDDFQIEHATLQVEPRSMPGTCQQLRW